jgi:CubicO group peptidase (beta-lactamase class C family)
MGWIESQACETIRCKTPSTQRGDLGRGASSIGIKTLLTSVLLAVFVLAVSGCSSPFADLDVARVDAMAGIRQEMEGFEEDGMNGVLLVRYKDEVLLHEAYGWRDRAAREPMTLDTGFDIGSITKPITDATVLKLEEQGRLSTRDTLGEFFPSVPADKRGITVRQLMKHSAGLPEYLGGDYELVGRDRALERILGEPLRFPPGSDEAYSNAGYSLLAMVVEEASGKTYEQAVRDAALEPAGTTGIGYVLPGWKQRDLAVGYGTFFQASTQERGRWGTPLDKPWLDEGPSWTLRGNGGMLATAEQLADWFYAVYAGEILGPEALDKFYELNGGGNWLTGGMRVGQAGGNGVFNAQQESWVDRAVHFTLLTSTSSPNNAESVWEEIGDEASTLAQVAARSER